MPTLRDLLKPAAQRPKFFYRGYDVYDPFNVGFVSTAGTGGRALEAIVDTAERPVGRHAAAGTPYDVNWRSNGNNGHEYGVNLPPADKDALIEYLKTL